MKVLFLGNSFTYFNDLPKMVMDMAAKAEFDLVTDSVTKGAAYLHQFANPNHELYQKWKPLYDGEEWDYVILQDQSANPMLQPEDYITSVRQLRSLMRPGQKILLYQTWAYKDATEKLATVKCSYEEMWTALEAACQRAGADMQLGIVPVGRYFAEVYKQHPEVELYCSDAFHPSPVGTYMAACLFLHRFSGQAPRSFSIPEDVPAEEGAIIRTIANSVAAI